MPHRSRKPLTIEQPREAEELGRKLALAVVARRVPHLFGEIEVRLRPLRFERLEPLGPPVRFRLRHRR